MRKLIQNLHRILFWSIVVLSISSCATQENMKVQSWIDTPQDGASFTIGAPVTVISHAYAKDGIAEAVLIVNGEAYRRDPVDQTGKDMAAFYQEWIPQSEGIYTLQVQAVDINGEEGNPAMVTIQIKPPNTLTPTPVDTLTPSFTPTPVDTLTFTPTATMVPSSTFTPTPVRVVTTVEVKPPQAQDTTPPPVPVPVVPANGLSINCKATQTLAWQPVSDPSGISGYYVKLERNSGSGEWQSIGGYGPITGKQVDVPVECGIYYRWMVRAQDGAGNYSGWSSASAFAINLE